jgi:hypothetical protein
MLVLRVSTFENSRNWEKSGRNVPDSASPSKIFGCRNGLFSCLRYDSSGPYASLCYKGLSRLSLLRKLFYSRNHSSYRRAFSS